MFNKLVIKIRIQFFRIKVFRIRTVEVNCVRSHKTPPRVPCTSRISLSTKHRTAATADALPRVFAFSSVSCFRWFVLNGRHFEAVVGTKEEKINTFKVNLFSFYYSVLFFSPFHHLWKSAFCEKKSFALILCFIYLLYFVYLWKVERDLMSVIKLELRENNFKRKSKLLARKYGWMKFSRLTTSRREKV